MFFVIAGGVAVNDPKSNGSHDRFPYNFLNPVAMKAKELIKAGKSVSVAVYVPAYEARALKQVNEHATVTVGALPCSAAPSKWEELKCDVGYSDPPKDSQHFIKIIRNSVTSAGATYVPLRSGKELNQLFIKTKNIEGIYYFGHSNDKQMFLEYGVTVPMVGTETWGVPRAKHVPKTNLASGAKFVSYGCNQGDPGGLCESLSKSSLWGIRCVGSIGKTNFGPIGQGQPYPSTNGGWVAYVDGVQEKTTVKIANE